MERLNTDYSMVVPFPDHRSTLRKMDNDQIDDIYVELQEKAIEKPKKNERYQIYHFFTKDPECRMLDFEILFYWSSNNND